MSIMRAKMRVALVNNLIGPAGETWSQTITCHAIYGDSPENKVWAKATPSAQLTVQIDNPGAWDLLKQGQEFYLDFTPISGAQQ